MATKGIDYGLGITNIDSKTGIRYGVISQNEVLQAWADSSQEYYGKPFESEIECPNCEKSFIISDSDAQWGDDVKCSHCGEASAIELPEDADAISFFIDDGEYLAECGEDGDIFITKSPYYTRAQFCSPCAPDAVYLTEHTADGEKGYCFGHDFFEGGKAPYPVYRVTDDTEVVAKIEGEI